jgi:hypothetical protein
MVGVYYAITMLNADRQQDVIQRIKQFIFAHPDVENDTSRWIEGMGWDQTKWEGAKFPTAVRPLLLPLVMGSTHNFLRLVGGPGP